MEDIDNKEVDSGSAEEQKAVKKKISLNSLVLIEGIILIVLFVAIFTIVGTTQSRITDLSVDTRDNLLPEILDQQRIARNIEKFILFGDRLLNSQNPSARRDAQLAAQILAFDEIFNNKDDLEKLIRSSYSRLSALGRKKFVLEENKNELLEKVIRFEAENIYKKADEKMHLKLVGALIAEVIESTSYPDLLLVFFKGEEEKEKMYKGFKQGPPSYIEKGWSIFKDIYEKQVWILQEEEKMFEDWNMVVNELGILADSLAVGSAAKTADRFTQIDLEAKMSQKLAYGGLGGIIFILFVSLWVSKKYIVQPLVEATDILKKSSEGEKVESGVTAIVEEVHQILDASDMLSKTMHELDREKNRMHDIAITDALTGLYNRRYFNEILPRELRRAQRANSELTFIMLDLDNFKKYNDLYGHQSGDDLLSIFGNLLNSFMRRGDDYAFRLGGEEFGIICSSLDRDQAMGFAERVREATYELNIIHVGNPFKVATVSVGGVCVVPCEGLRGETLVKYADKALYSSKNLGRNRVYFEKDFDMEC